VTRVAPLYCTEQKMEQPQRAVLVLASRLAMSRLSPREELLLRQKDNNHITNKCIPLKKPRFATGEDEEAETTRACSTSSLLSFGGTASCESGDGHCRWSAGDAARCHSSVADRHGQMTGTPSRANLLIANGW